MLNDQYSKFLVVTVHQATSWESLKPELDKTFACQGIPVVVTSYGGPPYGGREIEEYCEQMGFQHRITTPELHRPTGWQRPS